VSLATANVNSDITFFYYSKLKKGTCLPPTHFLHVMQEREKKNLFSARRIPASLWRKTLRREKRTARESPRETSLKHFLLLPFDSAEKLVYELMICKLDGSICN
jgi:hypothetical protein